MAISADIAVDILTACHPFKPFTYWGHQFKVVTKRTHHKHPRYLAQSYVEYGLLVGMMVHYMLHAFVPRKDLLARVYLFDVLGLNGIPVLGQLEYILSVVSIVVFYHTHYERLYGERTVYKTIKWLVEGRCDRLTILFRNRYLIRRTMASIETTWKVFQGFIVLAGKYRLDLESN